MDRHPKVTVRAAPSMGPARLATPQMPLNRPWMRARSRSEKRSPETTRATGISPPAPSPCSTRAAMRWVMVCAAAQAPAPTTKSEIAMSRMRRRP